MTVHDVAIALDLRPSSKGDVTKAVTGAYCSDMLSDVMAHARSGQVWVTMQGHQNVAAVALLTNVAAVIITGDHQPSQELVERAAQESLSLYTTSLSTYEVAGRIYQLLAGA